MKTSTFKTLLGYIGYGILIGGAVCILLTVPNTWTEPDLDTINALEAEGKALERQADIHVAELESLIRELNERDGSISVQERLEIQERIRSIKQEMVVLMREWNTNIEERNRLLSN